MDKSVKTSWQKKMQIKNERQLAKQCEQEIKDSKQAMIEVLIQTLYIFVILFEFIFDFHFKYQSNYRRKESEEKKIIAGNKKIAANQR